MDYFTEQDVAKKLQLAKTMVAATTTHAKGFGHAMDVGHLLGNWLDIMAREFIFNEPNVHYARDLTDVIAANKKFTMDRSGSAKDCAKAWGYARHTKTGTWDQHQEQWTWNAVAALLELFVSFLKFVVLIQGLDSNLKQAILMKRMESELWRAVAEWVDTFDSLHGMEKKVHALRALVRDEDIDSWKRKISIFDQAARLIMDIRKIGNKAAKDAQLPAYHPLAGHQRRY